MCPLIVSRYLSLYLFIFSIVCFTSYFMFSIAVLPHSPGVVYYHLLFSQGCPLLFSNRNLGSFCAKGTEILTTHSIWEVVDHFMSYEDLKHKKSFRQSVRGRTYLIIVGVKLAELPAGRLQLGHQGHLVTGRLVQLHLSRHQPLRHLF